jgi:hypothetical protein
MLSDKELQEHTADQLSLMAMEEAAEVIQAASKMKRFGLLGHHPNSEELNVIAFFREFHQLQSTIRIFCGKIGVDYRNVASGQLDRIDHITPAGREALKSREKSDGE